MADKPRLLIVDDDDTVLKLLTKLFSEDYEVTTASTASDGLESIEKSLDVVLLDIMLPDPSGIEILKAIKEVGSDIQVIMITGYASLETSTEALRLGAYDYILKPFDFSDFEILFQHIY